jgi:YD repeat-containing protein
MRLFSITSMRVFITGLVLSIFFVPPALSQDTSNSVMAGLNPYADYHGGDIDSISMAGGGLNLHIPILSDHSQRGKLNFSYSLVSSSSSWILKDPIKQGFPFTIRPTGNNGLGGRMPPTLVTDGTATLGYITAQANDGTKKRLWYVRESDGAIHHMGNLGSGGLTAYPYYLESVDGTGIRATVLNSSLNNIIVLRNGVQFNSSYPSDTFEDPNGNQISTTTTYDSNFGYLTSMIDTLGRTWSQTSTTDFSHCPVAASKAMNWTIPAPNGGVSVYKFCYSTISIQTNFTNVPPNTQQASGPSPMITGVVLPNLTTWRLDYNNYGDVVKVTFPTGGTIAYQYTYYLGGCGGSTGTVTSRTVFDGTNSATWNYQTSTGASVTDPLGNDIVVSINAACSDVAKQIKYYSGPLANGNLLKTVTKTFTTIVDPFIQALNSSAPNPTLPLSTTTTWANGQVTQEQQTYDPGFPFSDYINYGFYCPSGCSSPYGLIQTQSHYDYGNGSPGPLLSTTNTNYVALSNSTYATANILDLPSSAVTLNGSGYKCAETDYAYDDPAKLTPSGVTEQHVAAPNSVRGNLSSTTQQLSPTPCQSNASWTPITSYHNVYDTGEPYQSIDPLGHTTTYAYSPTYYGAYPTTVTNALNQSTAHVYDFNTGLLTSTTDPNSLTTSYSHDNMLRLIQSIHPDGGQETITYQESAYPFTTTVSTPINPSQNKTTVSVFDGLGRPTQTKLTSDPQGTVYTDTTYDALGHVHSVSNPYRQGSDITTSSGITVYAYDATGRKISETYPDNSILTTAYCGSSALVTDPTARWRRSRADGLGRLVEVDEPNAIGASVAATGCRHG